MAPTAAEELKALYEQQGFLTELPVLSITELREAREAFAQLEREFGKEYTPYSLHDVHLKCDWVMVLAKHIRVLEMILLNLQMSNIAQHHLQWTEKEYSCIVLPEQFRISCNGLVPCPSLALGPMFLRLAPDHRDPDLDKGLMKILPALHPPLDRRYRV